MVKLFDLGMSFCEKYLKFSEHNESLSRKSLFFVEEFNNFLDYFVWEKFTVMN